MNNKTAAVKKWLLAALLSCAAACLLLGGCGSMDSCISGCSVLRSIWTPELGLTEDMVTPMPIITGSIGAEELTEALEAHYEPIAQKVKLANETLDIFTLEHNLIMTDNKHYLHSEIRCSSGGKIDLPRIYIPYSGETELPVWSIPETVRGSRNTAAWIELTANRVETEWSGLDEQVTVPEIIEMYLDYYRTVSGQPIDTSRFAPDVQPDQLCREAMVLGLCDAEYEFDNTEPEAVTLLDIAADLLSAMYSDACGKGTAGFTESDLMETLDVFVRFAPLDSEKWHEDSSGILADIDARLREIPGEGSGRIDATRQSVASSLVDIYEHIYGTYEDTWFELCDTDDPDCQKANSIGFMLCFPSGSQFAPDYNPRRWELPGFAEEFIFSCSVESVENIWDIRMTRGDAVRMLSAVDICVRREGVSKQEPIIVNNTRSYDWYYTQHGTGWYSSVNCMPTIAMMATKWYDPSTTVTIEGMRDRYLPDYNGGWYTWQVAECLAENGVPNELVDVGEDILPYLDDGKIILSQMSEAADDESGHCFIIYGYWKRGDTVKYFVHDPDVYDGIDEFGQRPGRSMVMCGHYCDWIIDRIAFSYIVVG